MTGGWLPARKWAAWCAVLMVGLLAGCGGGGAGSGGGGDSGIKVLRVTLKNQSGLSIGRNADGTVTGLRVLFSEPRSLAGAPLDLRDRCTVSTWAGTGAYSSVDGRLDEASFQGSVAVATGDGSVQFVTDFGSGRVRQIADGTVNTVAISEEVGGVQVPLNLPLGLAYNRVDRSLWVCDAGGHRVRRITLDGLSNTICGSGVAGSTDGPGGTALCNRPTGITVSPTGDVYFTEGAGNRVRQITYMGGNSDAERRLATNYQVTTIAGSGLAGIADGTSNTVLFNNPLGIAWGDGNLYVADTGNRRIRRVSVTGETVTIAGTGVSGSSDGYGDTATFNSPVGICWTSRGLVITDRSAHVVRLCSLRSADAPSSSPSSWIVRRLAGNGTAGIADGTSNTVQFNAPFGVSEDSAGNLYVADYSNSRIRRLTSQIGAFDLGQPGSSGGLDPVRLVNADGVAPQTGFGSQTPFRLYNEVVDNGARSQPLDWWFAVPAGVRAFDFQVVVEAVTDGPATPGAGSTAVGSSYAYLRTLAGGTQSGSSDGVAAQARFGQITGMATDAAGNVYVSDGANHSVRRIGVDGRVTTIVGVDGTAGGLDSTGDVATLDGPGGLVVNPEGTALYVTEQTGHRVRLLELCDCGDPTLPADWDVFTIAGTGVSPGVAAETNGTGDVATFEGPYGICRDSVGTLFVTEQDGHRVRRIQYLGGDPADPLSYRVSTYAGSGADGGTDGTGTAASFSLPAGVAIDQVGNLYVADATGSVNGRVRKISPDRQVTTLATGVGYPRGIAVDTAGMIYVVESQSHVVTRLAANGATRRIVAGATGASGNADGPGDTARLYSPNALTRDVTGNLYVADGPPGPCRVRIVQRVLANGRPGEPVSNDF